MVEIDGLLEKYGEMGEKTGWTYLAIPKQIAHAIKPDTKVAFRVKGWLDQQAISQIALVPIGEGDFILPLKADLRRRLRKEAGYKVKARLEWDDSELIINEDFMLCLGDEPEALAFFNTLTKGHQRYYNNWIESGKTVETRSKRILQSIVGFKMGLGYPEMIRYFKAKKDKE